MVSWVSRQCSGALLPFKNKKNTEDLVVVVSNSKSLFLFNLSVFSLSFFCPFLFLSLYPFQWQISSQFIGRQWEVTAMCLKGIGGGVTITSLLKLPYQDCCIRLS
ncbi:uncharacterized protein A4U43_C08F14830 [Asparagus officinalis]|nr:uncharacterized protein A4U43_C08F14830 [Asparagus officinalis]